MIDGRSGTPWILRRRQLLLLGTVSVLFITTRRASSEESKSGCPGPYAEGKSPDIASLRVVRGLRACAPCGHESWLDSYLASDRSLWMKQNFVRTVERALIV